MGLGALVYFSVRDWRLRAGVAVGTAIVLALLTVPKVHLDAKLWGVILSGASAMILFAMPWLDRSPVKSMRYRPAWHRLALGAFVAAFLVLGYLGMLPPNPLRTAIAQIATAIYFGFFALMPWWSRLGEFKAVPDRVRFVAH